MLIVECPDKEKKMSIQIKYDSATKMWVLNAQIKIEDIKIFCSTSHPNFLAIKIWLRGLIPHKITKNEIKQVL